MSKNLVTPKQEPMGPDAVRNMMLAAQKQIKDRQQELNFTVPTASPQQRLAELKGRIASQLGQLLPVPAEDRDRPVHVTIDKEGRTIDSLTGEVLQIPSRTPTLKANLRVQKKDVIKQELPKTKQNKEVVIEHPGLDASALHFDARIGTHPAVRNRRQLVFNKKGKYEEIANRQRAKAKLEKLQQEISQIAKKTGIAVENKVTIIQPKKFFSELDVPDVEWWDYVILQQNNYSSITPDASIPSMLTGITQLIEHPIQLKAPSEPNKPVLLPIHLTRHEQRKLRRQNRAEVLKEQQEKIRLGLMPPPEPKVKVSSMMRVLCSDAVQDPTKVEQYVRNQMAQRIRTHEETNAARKLSAEQRREKKTKRTTEDTTNGVHASVYRVRLLDDPAKRFKIETNCKQLHMTGCVVLCKDINIIVVEGGPKQQKKFRRLMLHRIKWSSSSKSHMDDDGSEEQNKEKNKCVLLWQGTVKERSFGEIKFKSCPTENFAREHFRRHGVEHYWDIGHNDSVLDASTD
ncbi:unnamed protein product [Rotaria sordida]|uniref:Uncharacterized protein n=1 Tax=Rotaria sordida TaxID=392033 RepID=A0A813UBW7_9BILA|nr:unnamed protein product [Rotaria sordida]CAF0825039.1 unnamed protein product [Rotaria sordida]CAF0846623.1 unnamed protein product [Rotaria sordida]CAF0853171.1 unnamed protein product [Rotaria sordida]CAF3795944.1 unnamed protein product [Rotaria sordida]